jgi:hypothetical protein
MADTQSPPKTAYKRNIASLVGGFVIAGGVFAEALLLAGGVSANSLAVALLLACLVGGYVRLADL